MTRHISALMKNTATRREWTTLRPSPSTGPVIEKRGTPGKLEPYRHWTRPHDPYKGNLTHPNHPSARPGCSSAPGLKPE